MTFQSETDTEVIPKLCMYVYNNLTEPLAFSEVIIMLQPIRTCSHHVLLAKKLIFFSAFKTFLLHVRLITAQRWQI